MNEIHTVFWHPPPHLFARILTCDIHHADIYGGVGMVFGLFPDREHLHVPDQTPRSRQARTRFYVKIYKCVWTI